MRQNIEKKNLAFNWSKRGRVKRNFFYARFHYPYDRLNRPIASRKLDFFLSFQEEKKFFLILSYSSAAEI